MKETKRAESFQKKKRLATSAILGTESFGTKEQKEEAVKEMSVRCFSKDEIRQYYTPEKVTALLKDGKLVYEKGVELRYGQEGP